MSKKVVKLKKTSTKPKRIVKGKARVIHIRNLPEDLYEELWNLRAYIGAFDWVDVIRWVVEQYKQKVEYERHDVEEMLNVR